MEPHSGPILKPKQRKDGTWYAEASQTHQPRTSVTLSRHPMSAIGSLTRRTNISKGLGYSPSSRGLRGTIILHVERGAPATVARLATEPALVGVA